MDIYLRDLNNHIFIINALLETQRDVIFSKLDMYLSSMNNKMNDIMKILIIISTIFLPLSCLIRFYGMNFKYMSEFSYLFAYPMLISIIFVITMIMILFFKRKKWLEYINP